MKAITVREYIDHSIKVGDTVRIHDGSGLSLINDNSENVITLYLHIQI